VFERDAYYDEWWIPVVIAVSFAAGYLIGHWWAVGLAAAAPLLAIPAGDAEHGDTPVFVFMIYFAAGFGGLLALGVAFARHRSSQ
jgi:hypothetical protein